MKQNSLMRKEKQIVLIVQTKELEGESEYKASVYLTTLNSINAVVRSYLLTGWFDLKIFVSHTSFSWHNGSRVGLIIWN